ncbi:uncharacterized protein LOC122645284 [Telopea speciosissima]|uniref:uncharacterized protein LOC122645284 n=1 Tax=Telopea speciosissima TaxID=54955 RepID=UPI001CC35B68|nr:uncharacterized protein LOC122645284 [Telopea speciosissima]
MFSTQVLDGFRGVCRNLDSLFTFEFAYGIGWNYDLAAEAIAAKSAMILAITLNLNKIIIESDNLLIKQLLSRSSNAIPWRIAPILNDCFNMLHMFEDIRFSHVLREGNAVADSLVSFASTTQDSNFWFSPPPSISPLLYADSFGTLFLRQ